MVDIAAVDDPREAFVNGLVDELTAHAVAVGHALERQEFAFEARQAGARIGGVYAVGIHGWVLIKYLAVAPAWRRVGVGAALVHRLEAAALEKRALGMFVDTYGFQAPNLYRRLGYEEIARLPTPEPARTRVYYRKFLSPSEAGDRAAGGAA